MRSKAGTLTLLVIANACGEEPPPRRTYTYPTTQSCSPEGASRCAGTMVQTCSGAVWTTTQTCPAGTSCDDTAQPQCVADTTGCLPTEAGFQRCDAAFATVQECDGASWGAVQNCGPTMECVQTSGTTAECQVPPPCTHGEQRCAGNILETCVGSAWSSQVDCSPDVCATTSSTTAECQSVTCTATDAGRYAVCDGTAIVLCEGSTSQGVWGDCADLLEDGQVSGACYDYGIENGSLCVLPPGTSCLFSTTDSQTMMMACGTGAEPSTQVGCDQVSGVCVSLSSACTPSSTYSPTCIGNYLVVSCDPVFRTPQVLDCAAAELGSGLCELTACMHGTEGAPCYQGDEYVRCEPPLTCQNISEGWGECLPGSP